MGFLKLLQRDKKKSHNLGVCIPQHEQDKIETAVKEVRIQSVEIAKKNSVEGIAFELDGYYEVRDIAMLSGRVIKGRITKKKKAFLNDKEYKVSELQKAHQDVDVLEEGEHGAVFLKGKGLLVQTGSILEFK